MCNTQRYDLKRCACGGDISRQDRATHAGIYTVCKWKVCIVCKDAVVNASQHAIRCRGGALSEKNYKASSSEERAHRRLRQVSGDALLEDVLEVSPCREPPHGCHRRSSSATPSEVVPGASDSREPVCRRLLHSSMATPSEVPEAPLAGKPARQRLQQRCKDAHSEVVPEASSSCEPARPHIQRCSRNTPTEAVPGVSSAGELARQRLQWRSRRSPSEIVPETSLADERAGQQLSGNPCVTHSEVVPELSRSGRGVPGEVTHGSTKAMAFDSHALPEIDIPGSVEPNTVLQGNRSSRKRTLERTSFIEDSCKRVKHSRQTRCNVNNVWDFPDVTAAYAECERDADCMLMCFYEGLGGVTLALGNITNDRGCACARSKRTGDA